MSWLILRAARKLNIAVNLTVRVHDAIDPAFLRFAVECLFTERRGWPRFCGHKGLMNYARNDLPGIDAHVANRRISTGCHWMSVPGREYPMNDIPKINVALCFQHAFEEVVDTDPSPTLDKLFDGLRKHLDIAIEATAQGLLFHLEHMHEVLPELVMNLFCRHTLERGLDISQCADFHTLCVDGVGLGTIADSFAAIEQRVVDEGKITWKELREACREDFPDEKVRRMLLASDRYCRGSGRGDKWALAVSRLYTERVKARTMPPHVTLVPGWFSWSSTIRFGSTVGATPDGRKAGTPVTHGANPNPGFRKDGAPTALAAGVARIQCGYGNTCPLQIEFDPRIPASEGGIERVEELIRTHFDLGGTLVNINVLDRQTLMEANENPASHPDLVVRVTGFTAYFATLSPQFRQLVVDRFLDGM
jgi:pyruvate-formate lyase